MNLNEVISKVIKRYGRGMVAEFTFVWHANPHLASCAGDDAVYYATKLSGASNAKARRVLGWKPRRLEWLQVARVAAD